MGRCGKGHCTLAALNKFHPGQPRRALGHHALQERPGGDRPNRNPAIRSPIRP